VDRFLALSIFLTYSKAFGFWRSAASRLMNVDFREKEAYSLLCSRNCGRSFRVWCATCRHYWGCQNFVSGNERILISLVRNLESAAAWIRRQRCERPSEQQQSIQLCRLSLPQCSLVGSSLYFFKSPTSSNHGALFV